MNASRLAGLLLPALLAVPASPVGSGASPDFDQGVDASAELESVRRAAREQRAPFPESGPLAEEFGFSTGNEFSAVLLYGELSVSCSEGGQYDTAYYRCREEVLDPAESARFTGPRGVDADRVELSAVWETGTVREKDSGWEPAAGRSAGRFNLWIRTLLQRPLLDYGRNAVRYRLTKDGKIAREGELVAAVKRGQSRSCRRRRHYSSNNMSDCRAAASSLCDRYFRDEDYCQ